MSRSAAIRKRPPLPIVKRPWAMCINTHAYSDFAEAARMRSGRAWWLVEPGETIQLQRAPGCLFRADKWEASPGFEIEELSVLGISQLDDPAAAAGGRLKTCDTVGYIAVKAKNISDTPRVFQLLLEGVAVL